MKPHGNFVHIVVDMHDLRKNLIYYTKNISDFFPLVFCVKKKLSQNYIYFFLNKREKKDHAFKG